MLEGFFGREKDKNSEKAGRRGQKADRIVERLMGRGEEEVEEEEEVEKMEEVRRFDSTTNNQHFFI